MFGVFKHSNMLSWCAKKLRGKKIILQDFVSHKKKLKITLCVWSYVYFLMIFKSPLQLKITLCVLNIIP